MPTMCQVCQIIAGATADTFCYIMHSASFCESSHVILMATLSEVKGLAPIISQEEGELESKTHMDSQPVSMPAA
jgi:hypothetical protein